MTSEAFPQFELHVSQHRNSVGLEKLKDQNFAINRTEKGPNAVNRIFLGLTDFLLAFGQIITKEWRLDAVDQGKFV